MIVALLVSGPALADTTKFVFKEPADADGWTAISGTWKVKNKAYRASTEEDAFPVTILDEPDFTDVEVTFKFVPFKPGTYGSGVLRAKITGGNKLSGYTAQVTIGRGGAPSSVRINREDKIYGIDGMSETLCSEEIEPEKKTDLTFSAKGSRLTASYNGVEICSVKDTTYKSGKVGILSGLSEHGFTAVKQVIISD
jgi:hypothetical protein